MDRDTEITKLKEMVEMLQAKLDRVEPDTGSRGWGKQYGKHAGARGKGGYAATEGKGGYGGGSPEAWSSGGWTDWSGQSW